MAGEVGRNTRVWGVPQVTGKREDHTRREREIHRSWSGARLQGVLGSSGCRNMRGEVFNLEPAFLFPNLDLGLKGSPPTPKCLLAPNHAGRSTQIHSLRAWLFSRYWFQFFLPREFGVYGEENVAGLQTRIS